MRAFTVSLLIAFIAWRALLPDAERPLITPQDYQQMDQYAIQALELEVELRQQARATMIEILALELMSFGADEQEAQVKATMKFDRDQGALKDDIRELRENIGR